MRHMAELGLQAADPITTAAIEDLEQHGVFGRYLGLQACFASRSADRVLARLTDPSRQVRSLAIRLFPLVCDDDSAAQALRTAERGMRVVLLRGLSRAGRMSLI